MSAPIRVGSLLACTLELLPILEGLLSCRFTAASTRSGWDFGVEGTTVATVAPIVIVVALTVSLLPPPFPPRRLLPPPLPTWDWSLSN